MKTPTTRHSMTILLAVIGAAAAVNFGMSFSSPAAEAHLKGAERLVQPHTTRLVREAPTAALKSSMPPNCSACTMVTTSPSSTSATSAKGAEVLAAGGRPSKLVSTHGCDDCATTIGTAGHGKAKTRTVTHRCSKQGLTMASCCNERDANEPHSKGQGL